MNYKRLIIILEIYSKIQHNKQLILFAQRDYINATFGEYNQMDDVNTNVPWDWDHIYQVNGCIVKCIVIGHKRLE